MFIYLLQCDEGNTSQPYYFGSFCIYLNVVIILVDLGITNSLSSYTLKKHVNDVPIHFNIEDRDTSDEDTKGYPLLYQLILSIPHYLWIKQSFLNGGT